MTYNHEYGHINHSFSKAIHFDSDHVSNDSACVENAYGMKFYAGPTFLFSNMMTCHTFDVDIIMNALLTITNMVTSIIPHIKQYILIVIVFQTTVHASKTHME